MSEEKPVSADKPGAEGCPCACFETEDDEYPDQCCCGHLRDEHTGTGACDAE